MSLDFENYDDENQDFEIWGDSLSNGNYGLSVDGLSYEIYLDSDGYYSVIDEPSIESQTTLYDSIALVVDHVTALRRADYVGHS